MAGKKPDYILKLLFREPDGSPEHKPTKGAWRRLGAAWVHNNEARTIGITFDNSVPITLPLGARLILVPAPTTSAQDPQ